MEVFSIGNRSNSDTGKGLTEQKARAARLERTRPEIEYTNLIRNENVLSFVKSREAPGERTPMKTVGISEERMC